MATTTDNNNNNDAQQQTTDHRDGDRTLDQFIECAYKDGKRQQSLFQYWLLMLSLGIANSSDASEILCISYILSDPSFKDHMLEDAAWRGGLLASAVFLGMLVGGLFIGTMGDVFGRRPMLLLGLVCNAVAGCLSAVAPNVWILSMLRCIAGVGIGATIPPLFTLVTELAPSSKRGFFVSFCASFWMVGSIFVAVAALWSFKLMGLSWRAFAMLCALPSALGAVLAQQLVPESPRFLALQNEHEKAKDVANQLSWCMGYTGPPLTVEEVIADFPIRNNGTQTQGQGQEQTHDQAHDLTVELLPNANSHANDSSKKRLMTKARASLVAFWESVSLLFVGDIVKTTLPLMMVWFTLSFGSYGLFTWINTIFVEVHLQNVYFNALLFALANLPGNILSAALTDKLGRSPMLSGSIIAASICLLLFAAATSGTNKHPGMIVVSACLFQCFTITAWNTIDVMTSELFPTSVRSTGMGVCAASGRIGAMIAQFVNGLLISNPVRLLVVASCTLLLGAATPKLLPGSDMTGQPVEDEVAGSSSSSSRGGRRASSMRSNISTAEYQTIP